MPYNPSGGTTYNLGSSIGSTDTTILLSSFLEPISGVPYTMALMNTDIAYGTIAPVSAQSEFVSFTGITQNVDGTASITGVTRGLKRSYPFDSSSTFKIPHAGQSIFILSDAPQVFNSYAGLTNNNSFSGVNAFTQNLTVPDPINNTDAANKEWVLTVVNGGPITVSQVVVAGTAGETIAQGNPVYFKAADARWYKSTGSTTSTINDVQLGIAQGAGTTAGSITGGVMVSGIDIHQSGGSTGSIGYVSNTSTIATTTGTNERAVGNFITSTTFLFNPDYFYSPTASDKAALVGSSGTPSAANKFITQAGTSTTPAANSVPKLDSNGLIPQALINNTPIARDLTAKTAAASGVYTLAIPGGTLGTANSIKFTVLNSATVLGSGDSVTATITYGGSAVGTLLLTATASGSVSNLATLQGSISANGATNAQKCTCLFQMLSTGTPFLVQATEYNGASVDSTVSQNLVITLTRTNNGNLAAEGAIVTFM